MNSRRFYPWSMVCFVSLCLVGLIGAGCVGQRKSHRASSVVSFLYPGKSNPLPPTTIPVLRLPLRVGIAFVPSGGPMQGNPGAGGIAETKKLALMQRVADEFKGREYIQSIELVPTTYLRPGGGFENLDQVRGLLNIDVIALVAYDQVQFTNDSWLSLSYWTIIGLYIFHGNKNDTQTLMEAAVYDIPSRHLLFRAPGASEVKAGAAAVYVAEKLRADSAKGFDDATGAMIASLKTQLEGFRERIKNTPGEVKIEHKPGYTGGGATGEWFVAALGMLALGRALWRRK